jgi:NTP pyrophosphatase (non-canonical NTP hydrolase)
MTLRELAQRAAEIREQYANLERARHGRAWTREEIALGFVGDVGDLMKLVTALEGVRDIPDARAKLAHELADCLWCILVLSQMYDVDLEQTFLQTMDELERSIQAQA